MANASYDFEVNQTKIKGGCQSGRKVVPQDSKSDLPLVPICMLVVVFSVHLFSRQCFPKKYNDTCYTHDKYYINTYFSAKTELWLLYRIESAFR